MNKDKIFSKYIPNTKRTIFSKIPENGFFIEKCETTNFKDPEVTWEKLSPDEITKLNVPFQCSTCPEGRRYVNAISYDKYRMSHYCDDDIVYKATTIMRR